MTVALEILGFLGITVVLIIAFTIGFVVFAVCIGFLLSLFNGGKL